MAQIFIPQFAFAVGVAACLRLQLVQVVFQNVLRPRKREQQIAGKREKEREWERAKGREKESKRARENEMSNFALCGMWSAVLATFLSKNILKKRGYKKLKH